MYKMLEINQENKLVFNTEKTGKKTVKTFSLKG